MNLPGEYFINKYIETDKTFSVCTTDVGISRDNFGANFSAAMVGKSVEMEGAVNSGTYGTAAGIRMDLARQLKPVTSGMAMASGNPGFPHGDRLIRQSRHQHRPQPRRLYRPR